MLIDDIVSDEEALHRSSANLELRVAERPVCDAKAWPGREGHRDLIRSEVVASNLAPGKEFEFNTVMCLGSA